jgi:hypothetical protein
MSNMSRRDVVLWSKEIILDAIDAAIEEERLTPNTVRPPKVLATPTRV